MNSRDTLGILSRIKDHSHRGKTLTPKILLNDKIVFSSWVDTAIPSYLWACLVAANLDEQDAIDVFLKISDAYTQNFKDGWIVFPIHQVIATHSRDEFNCIFKEVLSNKKNRDVLSALMLFDSLPGRDLWENIGLEASDDSAGYLFNAVESCLDHQSDTSTFVRWFCEFLRIKAGASQYPAKDDVFVREVLNYSSASSTHTKSRIRASELAVRSFLSEGGIIDVSRWNNEFWIECMEHTQCYIGETKDFVENVNYDFINEGREAYANVFIHFISCTRSIRIDAKNETAFGIVLYALDTYINLCCSPYICNSKDGIILLRVVFEAYATLTYLVKKDDEEQWAIFRNHGAGQLKLAFLKFVEQSNVPDFVDMDFLHRVVHEDKYPEFQDINVGQWAGTNLRKMCEYAGIKDEYDAYYDFSSCFLHSNWGAIRIATLDTCLNPLHRWHKIGRAPAKRFGNVQSEMAKLVNKMLSLLDEAFPGIEFRLTEV